MRLHTAVGLTVVLATGAIVVWQWCQFQILHDQLQNRERGIPPRGFGTKQLGMALPTLMFLAAAVLRRRSARWQLIVAGIAVLVGCLQFSAIDSGMSQAIRDAEQGEQWGIELGANLAGVFAVAVAFLTVAVACIAHFMERARRSRQAASAAP